MDTEVRRHPIQSKRRILWEKRKRTLLLILLIVVTLVAWFSIYKPAHDQFLLLIPSGCSKKPAVKLSDGEKSAIQSWVNKQAKHFWAFGVESSGKPVPLAGGQESMDVQVSWRPDPTSLNRQHENCALVLQEYRDRSWRVISGSRGNVCYWPNP